MHILYVVPYVPDLIRVRPYQLIRHLGQLGHAVTVMTLWTTQAEWEAAERLRAECQQVVALRLPRWRSLLNAAAALPEQVPMQARYCWQPALAARNEAALWPASDGGKPAFDVVHIEHLRGALYGLHLLDRSRQAVRQPVPIVWDSVDSITHLFRQSSARSKKLASRLITRLELGRTARHEAHLANRFGRVLVTSRLDQEAFLGLPGMKLPAERIHVLPNGVDLEYFQPDPHIPSQDKTLVITGKMSYHANVSMVLHFTSRILPLIRASHPDVRVLVVGKDPPRSLQALSEDDRIQVTGTVPDIRPFLRQAAVAVAPLTYGAGIQNKVLEAMACGTPVVTTPRAVSALEVQSNVELLTAADEAEFARAVCSLLDNPGWRAQVGEAGRRYVERNHRWAGIASELHTLYAASVAELASRTDQDH